jgi:hypothetical protein
LITEQTNAILKLLHEVLVLIRIATGNVDVKLAYELADAFEELPMKISCIQVAITSPADVSPLEEQVASAGAADPGPRGAPPGAGAMASPAARRRTASSTTSLP